MSTHDLKQWGAAQDWESCSVVAMGQWDPDLYAEVRKHTDADAIVYAPDGENRKLSDSRIKWCDTEVELRRQLGGYMGRVEGEAKTLLRPNDPPEFLRALRDFAGDREINRNTIMKNAGRWSRAMLGAVHRYQGAVPISRIGRVLDGVTAIVCGAGPSLELAFDMLRKVGDRAVVIASNSSLGPLEAAGITPHVVVAMDQSPIIGEQLRRSKAILRTTIVAGHHANEYAFEAPCRRRLLAIMAGDPIGVWLAPLLKEAPIPAGGSVSTTALMVARTLGCSRVILVGQDCALTDNRAHADGAGTPIDAGELRDDGERTHYADGTYTINRLTTAWGGEGEVVSTPALHSFKSWLESSKADLEARGMECLNATGGGARIEGWPEIEPGDVLDLLGDDVDPDTLIGTECLGAPPVEMSVLKLALQREVAAGEELANRTREALSAVRKLARADDAIRDALAATPVVGSAVLTAIAAANTDDAVGISAVASTYEAAIKETGRGGIIDTIRDAIDKIGG
jgi:hypothetical protein